MPKLPTDDRRVSRPVPLRESVHNAILEMIVEGDLKAGQHLVEAELASRLGVSRQPVREALQWLNSDGWVDLRPAHGAYVHAPTPAEADQLLAVRGLLETESARLAAAHVPADGIEELRDWCRQGTEALEADDVASLVAANAGLHAAVARFSGNTVLCDLVSQVDRRVRWYFRPVARDRGAQSWQEHAELIEAIASGDGDRAAEVMRRHTELTRMTYLEHSTADDAAEATAEGAQRAG
ncbi:GntR family transcriptional regulator [Pseudonocardia parietis]|uniref:DNA-binding GntR family transcriptional regulator n=1 Tax=Pseudonocardia parietis TaxID=570936 RepID=A0ABS4VW87_9PSEU|nr:GntR family transcriptional regulator [Pseudonocardia parietis]MBP2367988.1 DNA-binding GntR family transcriptional regulator [Pseudonocardia parietis]